jgi:hypothetical protein
MRMGDSTAYSPGKSFNIINPELTQGRWAFTMRFGSITGQVPSLSTHTAQGCQCFNQQFSFIIA